MPQSSTGNWKVNDIPYGKGSLHRKTLEASNGSWRRAAKLNEAENSKCLQITTLLEKHRRAAENRKEKTIQRLRQSLEELEAYERVLESYRASKFRTLQWGFKLESCATPRTYHRCKLERRIYDSGFSVRTLRPEVTQVIEANRPEAKRQLHHERLLEVARRRSNFMIDRKWTNRGLLNDRRIIRIALSPASGQRTVVQASKRLLTTLHE